MIRTFKDRETEKLFNREIPRRLPPNIQRAGLRKLRMLDSSSTIDDLNNPPGNRLEQLKGERAGQLSIRINDQWRICFVWHNGDAYDVEITDYHS